MNTRSPSVKFHIDLEATGSKEDLIGALENILAQVKSGHSEESEKDENVSYSYIISTVKEPSNNSVGANHKARSIFDMDFSPIFEGKSV